MSYFNENQVEMIEFHLELMEIEMGAIVNDVEESSKVTEEEWRECEAKYKKVQQQASLIRSLLYPSKGNVLEPQDRIY